MENGDNSTNFIYGTCSTSLNPELTSDESVVCFAAQMIEHSALFRQSITSTAEATLHYYVVACSALVFFMQAGFAMLCAGAVRKKNLQNTMLKNLLDACGASVAFFAVGYAFAFGDNPDNPNTFIGTSNFFLRGLGDDYSFWIFQYSFSAASATIVAGTLAERCQMCAYAYYSVMLSGFVYPVVAHAIWSDYGYFSPNRLNGDLLLGVGVIDFAGSGVIHLTGGTTALVAAYILGPRRGRFHDEKTGEVLRNPRIIAGHNMGLQMLGTMILWFGWYGFNAGSALIAIKEYDPTLLSLSMTNTTLAGAAGGISALLMNMAIVERTKGRIVYNLTVSMNGALSGLVAVTGSCALIQPYEAAIIGIFAGFFYLLASWWLVRVKIDDAVDAIPVHMTNGIWGMLATGLFAASPNIEKLYGASPHPGLIYSIFSFPHEVDITLFGAQVIGLLAIIAWTVCVMTPFFLFLDYRGVFRVDAFDELAGLDLTGHSSNSPTPDQISTFSSILKEQQLKEPKQKGQEAYRPSNFGEEEKAELDESY